MRKAKIFFIAIAILLSNIMCAFVAYNYKAMQCGIEHAGYSAPAHIAFLYAIPFVIGIIVCVLFAIVFNKKTNKKKDE